MKIFSAEQTRELDQYTIANEPIASVDLMERASRVFSEWYREKFSDKIPVYIFCGIGNNGGDGLAVSRLLLDRGYTVTTCIHRFSKNSSADFRKNEERLQQHQESTIVEVSSKEDCLDIPENAVIIDALWGSGLARPIEGHSAELIEHLNTLSAVRVAIDIPSGLGTDMQIDGTKFKADHTLSFEMPKLAFMLPQNAEFVGKWAYRSIQLSPDKIAGTSVQHFYTDNTYARNTIRSRKKFSHKGSNGHSLIFAGSYGMIGAAILAAKACLKAGSGLATLHTVNFELSGIYAQCPEVMVSIDPEKQHITTLPELDRYSVVAFGPGVGQHHNTAAVLRQLIDSRKPLVIDADGLNILAANRDWLDMLTPNTILTPHPKEFRRLFGTPNNDYDRLELLRQKARELDAVIVLKGAHTAVALPNGEIHFNSTGNPALATAGSGDVLTGIIVALLAQQYTPKDAAILGVYLHGLVADIHQEHVASERMMASEIIEFLGLGFERILQE